MAFEIDFLPIGDAGKSGDAILVRTQVAYSYYEIYLVDGGYTSSYETIKNHIDKYFGEATRIDRALLTHSDKDHVSGLIEVVRNYEVGELYFNRPWLYAAEIIDNFHGNFSLSGLIDDIKSRNSLLIDLEALAVEKGIPIFTAFQGQSVGPFVIAAPSRARYLDLLINSERSPSVYKSVAADAIDLLEGFIKSLKQWVTETWSGETLSNSPPATSPNNETSVVQVANLDGKVIVLTGDAGPEALDEAYEYARLLGYTSPYFFQVPHHGSRRNVTPDVLNKWLGAPVSEHQLGSRGFAFCSSAKEDKDHPKKKVLNAFIRRGFQVDKTDGRSISVREGMPDRNWGPLSGEPFSSEVEE